MIPIDTVLFAAPDDDDMIEAARTYIKEHGWTRSDVAFGKADGQVLVRAKKELWWDERNQHSPAD